jgi:ParB-like chromosome segregation protein Spo0J
MSKFNWKREITDEDIEELAENIEEVGNLHPIIVRSVGKSGQMYEVRAGRRRLAAQKSLGSKKVDVRVVKCDDLRAEIISYSENLKVKRPDSKEWAVGVKRLVDLFEELYGAVKPKKNTTRGRPREPKAQAIKDAAKTLGASELSVRNAVKRQEDLTPSAARALETGSITQEQADILARLSSAQQHAQLMRMVRETREQTRNRRKKEQIHKQPDKLKKVQMLVVNAHYWSMELHDKLSDVLNAANSIENPTDAIQTEHLKDLKKLQATLEDVINTLG